MKWVEANINGIVVRIAFDADSIHIFDAYPIKDELKKKGFHWNSADKSWWKKSEDPDRTLADLSVGLFIPKTLSAPPPISQPPVEKSVRDEANGISVRQLRDRIEGLFEVHFPPFIWIRGIIASEVKNYRWAAYFDLGDEDAGLPFFFRVEIPSERLVQIEGRLAAIGVAEKLEKDLPVLLKVSLSVSQRYVVDVRLTVQDIVPEYTQSKIRNQREITLDKLGKENILSNQKALVLPLMIGRIGLITSAQGTSIQDIRSAMSPYENRYHIQFIDARMEGSLAVGSVVAAIGRFNHMSNPPDLIVLARGGGSEQSLAVFNDYRICREICLSKIPVLAAIGHEKDLSAAELCAYMMPTPATPSGAGKFLAQHWQGLLDSLYALVDTWIRFGQGRVENESRSLQTLIRLVPLALLRRHRYERRYFCEQIFRFKHQGDVLQKAHYAGIYRQTHSIRQGLERVLNLAKQDLGQVLQRHDGPRIRLRLDQQSKQIHKTNHALLFYGHRLFDQAGSKLEGNQYIIQAHSPEKTLKRGFTLLLDGQGKVISNRETFLQEGGGTLHFYDGETPVIPGDKT